jgi:hypothetical protein
VGSLKWWVAVALVAGGAACRSDAHEGAATQRRAHAEQVAETVLRHVVVPSSARAYHDAIPASIASPLSRPSFPTLVDQSHIWIVPESPAVVVAFLQAQRTPDFVDSGGVATSGVGGHTTEWGLSATALRSFGSDIDRVQLLQSVAAAPHGSYVRADAIVVWLPPRDHDEHVSDADRVVTLSRQSPSAPVGKPKTRRLVVTDQKQVARLAAIFNALPTALGGWSNCGLDQGVSYTIAFSTAATARPDVVVTAGVCVYSIDVHGHRATGVQTDALATAAAALLGIKGSAVYSP